ncbi:hypothetical protein [Oceaniovalibus sp. ACAM 378]|uniref:hypothetical protein n=1 Tax=Oceaniovalibus sp. ACAM 378 TaxID=2599923 RepID=UPI0011D59A6C|nr:hypothetical protein FQ320_03400 [Oceaniovalibus sp. ACAM 378]
MFSPGNCNDFAFLGCSGIDTDGRVMDFDPSKIAVKKAAMQRSAHSFLLASRQSSDVRQPPPLPGLRISNR